MERHRAFNLNPTPDRKASQSRRRETTDDADGPKCTADGPEYIGSLNVYESRLQKRLALADFRSLIDIHHRSCHKLATFRLITVSGYSPLDLNDGARSLAKAPTVFRRRNCSTHVFPMHLRRNPSSHMSCRPLHRGSWQLVPLASLRNLKAQPARTRARASVFCVFGPGARRTLLVPQGAGRRPMGPSDSD
jgi:hypothetical protein